MFPYSISYFVIYCAVKLSVVNTLFFFLLQDLNLSTERLTSNKAFTNKLWNAGKFLLQNLPDKNDVSAWDVLLSNKVAYLTSNCTRYIHYFLVLGFKLLVIHLYLFVQFDSEASLQKLPLPECWVVSLLLC